MDPKSYLSLLISCAEGGENGGGGAPPSGPQGGQNGGQAPQPQSGGNGGQSGNQTPPWGTDEQFDPQRAWNLLQNVRGDLAQAQAARDELKGKVTEFENAGKSESERLTGDRDSWKGRAETAEGKLRRLEIGLEKGLTPAQCARLVGTTEDELKADADAFLAELPQRSSGQAPPTRRPAERMPTGGSEPEQQEPDEDPFKVAARIRRY